MQDKNATNINEDSEMESLDLAARRAVNRALWMKKRLGQSAVVWKDDRVAVIPPEEIVIDEELLKQDRGRVYPND